MRKKVLLLVLICGVLGLNAGCQKDGKADPANGTGSNTSEIMKVTENGSSAEGQSDSDAQQSEGVKLYISTGDGKFKSCDYSGTEEPTPDSLVKEMETLTGWNISLADEITTGKGGMTVCITGQSAVFMGPPAAQKEGFHVYDAQSMVYAVLDSIQKTLQTYASPKNPDSVDIYYSMEGNVPIRIDNLDITIPMDQPYTHEMLVKLFQQADAPTGTGSSETNGKVQGSRTYGQTDAGSGADQQSNYLQTEAQGGQIYQQPEEADGQEGYQQPGAADGGANEQPGSTGQEGENQQPGTPDGGAYGQPESPDGGAYGQPGAPEDGTIEQPEAADGVMNGPEVYQQQDVTGTGDMGN